jgi:hypothetical protein
MPVSRTFSRVPPPMILVATMARMPPISTMTMTISTRVKPPAARRKDGLRLRMGRVIS